MRADRLVAIAQRASECQVLIGGGPTRCFRHNVVNFQERANDALGGVAIGAAIAGNGGNAQALRTGDTLAGHDWLA